MSKKLKLTIAKGAATMALVIAAASAATSLVGGNTTTELTAQDVKTVTLASAQISVADPTDLASQLPADAMTPGKTLPREVTTVPAPRATDCTVAFDATLMEGAMVRLTLAAPCDPNGRVAIHHEQLTFDMLTDANGALRVDVPTLSAIAMFTASINDQSLQTIAAIPDFESYDRVALQWQGQTGLQIHALELGADYGGDGHVWADAPGSSLRAVRARGGFITRLGDNTLSDGRTAEIYVFPSGTIQRDGTVRLSVEAEVNALTCDKAIMGQALQPDASGTMQLTELILEIPPCTAIGDILVLKNLLRDMKIASN